MALSTKEHWKRAGIFNHLYLINVLLERKNNPSYLFWDECWRSFFVDPSLIGEFNKKPHEKAYLKYDVL